MPIITVLGDTTTGVDFTQFTNSMTSGLSGMQTAGIAVVLAAIGVGVLFLGAKFLWGKVKQWLAKI